jgi:chromosome condensin MukBEF ATPase and DNA-binding subunit MukB
MAFTEQGVAMLSGILKSKQAREVNIAIMRAFVQMRKYLETNKELAIQLKKLERRLDKNDEAINRIFEAIRQLMLPPNPPRKKIGFMKEANEQKE